MEVWQLNVLELSTTPIREANSFRWDENDIQTDKQFSFGQLQMNQTGFSAIEKTIWDSSDILGNVNWSLGAPGRFCVMFPMGFLMAYTLRRNLRVTLWNCILAYNIFYLGSHVTLLWSKYSVEMNILPVHKLYFAHFLLYNQQHKQKLLKMWQQTFQTLRS